MSDGTIGDGDRFAVGIDCWHCQNKCRTVSTEQRGSRWRKKKSVFVSNAISVTNIDQKFEFSNAITKLFARMLYVINAVSVRDH